MRLTERAHAIVATRLRAGDWAIDATAGNGYDTCFLAEAVGPTGRVFAFDVQPTAIAATAQRLGALVERVTLIAAGHEAMARHVPTEAAGRIGAVLFNLGYLPGGDKDLITTEETTCRALDAASRLLAPAGIMSILVYRGHSGGSAEAHAVEQWLAARDVMWSRETFEPRAARDATPVLYVLRRPA